MKALVIYIEKECNKYTYCLCNRKIFEEKIIKCLARTDFFYLLRLEEQLCFFEQLMEDIIKMELLLCERTVSLPLY